MTTGSKGPRKQAFPSSMENLPVKKARFASKEAPSAATKITVTVDPKLLECCVCSNTLVPPLYQCDNGHITCSDCYSDLDDKCDRCFDPINTTTRCRAVERLLAGLTVPCQFKEHGCREMMPYSEKPEHEESCPHAPCYCPFAGCRRPYSGALLDHINQEHREIIHTAVLSGTISALKLEDGEAGRLLYLSGGRAAVFLLLVDDWSVPSGRSLSVVRLMAEPFEEDDFKYEIQVYARTGMLTLSGNTQSVGRMTTKDGQVGGGASLFVPDAMWSLEDSPVYVQLK